MDVKTRGRIVNCIFFTRNWCSATWWLRTRPGRTGSPTSRGSSQSTTKRLIKIEIETDTKIEAQTEKNKTQRQRQRQK